MSCMDEISVTDVDHEEDEDWDIGFSAFAKQTLQNPLSECNNHGGEEEEEEEEDDDEDDDDYDDEEYEDGDYDGKVELGCPYCVENFDILGLCCHIDDQHYKEAKSGICPICDKTLDSNMTVHIIAQHESMLRALRRVKVRSGGVHTGLSRLKIDDHSFTHLQASSPVGSSSDLPPDPLFLSFVQTRKPPNKPESLQPKSSSEAPSPGETSNWNNIERSIEPPSLTDKSQDQLCEFVSGLVFSTIFDDL